MVCVECTIGLDIVLDASMQLLGDVGHVEYHFFLFETVLVSAQDRCMVWARHTLGLEIVLDTPDGTPRRRGSSESSFQSVSR